MSVTGVISNISRCSVNDGPGVRTVVYFKGCNLRCKWCHNPELISFHRELAYFPQKCIFCGRCVMVCPKVHIIENNLVKLKRECCTACGKCADECPANALELIGKEMSADEVFTEVLKDRHFFNESGGGVTFSGGDPLCPGNRETVGQLIAEIHERFPEKTIWLYTGDLFESFRDTLPFLPLIDVIVDGPYVEALRDVNLRWRGSKNQRVIDVKQTLATGKVVLWARN